MVVVEPASHLQGLLLGREATCGMLSLVLQGRKAARSWGAGTCTEGSLGTSDWGTPEARLPGFLLQQLCLWQGRVELSGVWALPLHLCSAWALLAGQTVPGTEGCPQTPLGLDVSWEVPSSSPTTFLLGRMFLGSYGQEGLSWSFTTGPHWKRSPTKPVLAEPLCFWGNREHAWGLGSKGLGLPV